MAASQGNAEWIATEAEREAPYTRILAQVMCPAGLRIGSDGVLPGIRNGNPDCLRYRMHTAACCAVSIPRPEMPRILSKTKLVHLYMFNISLFFCRCNTFLSHGGFSEIFIIPAAYYCRFSRYSLFSMCMIGFIYVYMSLFSVRSRL